MTHPVHQNGLTGGFTPLALPPADDAPRKVAKQVERYRTLTTELRTAQHKHRRYIDNQSVDNRTADSEDANAVAEGREPTAKTTLTAARERARLDVLAVKAKLDNAVVDLISAITEERAEWAQALDAKQADAQQSIDDALITVEREAQRLHDVGRIATWLAQFPERTKWGHTPPPTAVVTPISDLARYSAGQIPASKLLTRPPREDTPTAA
jgi:hypothetical protein